MRTFAKKTAKHRLDIAAWIAIGGEFGLRPCTLVEVTEGGARLDFDANERLPKSFNLIISRATREGKPCKVNWRQGKSVEVSFVAR